MSIRSSYGAVEPVEEDRTGYRDEDESYYEADDGFTVADERVEQALYELALADRAAAWDAYAAYEALSWGAGDGLASLTRRDLAGFLWDELPTRWMCPLAERLRVAAALGTLLAMLGKAGHAAMCTSTATERVLTVYARHGNDAGGRAARAARSAACLDPPDLPGVHSWASFDWRGDVERRAHRLVGDALEHALEVGVLVPGTGRARRTARQITADVLGVGADQPGGGWLAQVRADRIDGWARGSRLREALVDQLHTGLAAPLPPPAAAERHLAPIRWLLAHAAAGAPLTAAGTLAGAVVADARERFGWARRTGNPRAEQLTQLRTLRELACQMQALRRRGGRLCLTRYGQQLHQAATGRLWQVTMAQLPGRSTSWALCMSSSDAAAAEAALLLLVAAGRPLTVTGLDEQVARLLTADGWDSGLFDGDLLPTYGGLAPVSREQVRPVLAVLRERLRLFTLVNNPRVSEPIRLCGAGRNAAHAALGGYALRPWHQL